ncbi:MAG: 2Fe-2S iron-sulfur cluster-binding protein [Microcystaceae cyanobacterium]
MSNNGTFAVTLINEEKGINQTIAVAEDEFILDIAEEDGMNLPYSCRAGTCFDCLGQVTKGEVELSEKSIEFLKPEELDAGYVLLCSSTPKSDCTIITHQAEVLLGE